MEGWLLLGTLALVLVMLIYAARRSKRPSFLAFCEYWIYLPGVKLPEQEALMTRIVAENPHTKRGKPAIGAKEGMLFTDIRLHLAMAIRTRNPHVFRPDLFAGRAEPTKEMLARLAESSGMAKARYASEQPLEDLRHLQFLPHMASAVAALGQGSVIFDKVQEKLFTVERFDELLNESVDCARPEFHTRILWIADEEVGHAETRGLRKIGLRELRTAPVLPDQRTLVTQLLQEAVGILWKLPTMPPSIEIEIFDDQFLLTIIQEANQEQATVRIGRRQAT